MIEKRSVKLHPVPASTRVAVSTLGQVKVFRCMTLVLCSPHLHDVGVYLRETDPDSMKQGLSDWEQARRS